jgi:hypothetical protein
MSSQSVPYNYPMPTLSGAATELCGCKQHCLLHPASEVYPPCQYNERSELYVNSKGESTFSIAKPPHPDPVKVMEEDGWFIEKEVLMHTHHDPHNSWIGHYCPSLKWKVYMNEKFMMDEGLCTYCYEVVPPGFIALWQLHNFEYIQAGNVQADDPMEASCSA